MKKQLTILFTLICLCMSHESWSQLIASFEERMPFGENPTPHHDGYTKRVLTNRIYIDPEFSIELKDGGITFPKGGHFFICASAPAYYVERHRLLLQDSSGNNILSGTSEYASYEYRGSSKSQILGEFKADPNTVYYLIHYTEKSQGNSGEHNPSLGVDSSLQKPKKEEETFAQVMIYRIK